MKKIILFMAILIVFLGIPVMVKAAPPVTNAVFATVKQLDALRADLIALAERVTTLEKNPSEDFAVPDWIAAATTIGNISLSNEGEGCSWHEQPINAQTKAVVIHNEEEIGHAAGTCHEISFEQTAPLQENDSVEILIYHWWMGNEKEFLAPTTVVPNDPPVCQSLQANVISDLLINFEVFADDENKDQLTFTWTFGDGEQATGNETNISHWYLTHGTYEVSVEVNDGGASDFCYKTLTL